METKKDFTMLDGAVVLEEKISQGFEILYHESDFNFCLLNQKSKTFFYYTEGDIVLVSWTLPREDNEELEKIKRRINPLKIAIQTK